LWGIGALGIVGVAYGCGGSSKTDQDLPPLRGGSGRAGASGNSGGAGKPASAGGGTSGTNGESTGGTAGANTSAGRAGGAGSAASAGREGNAGSAAKGGSSGTGGTGGSGTAGRATGGNTAGGEAGTTSGAGGEGGSMACNPDDTSVPFKTRCLACAKNACGECLCTDCTSNLQTCQNTPGCQDIAQCVVDAGCKDVSCYCGSVAEATCLATGQADGPCKDVILNAPGGHAPSATDISAGPAATAAIAVGLCATMGGACETECQ
jgi:hypothetical protein